jgi:hypothetical protein
MITRRMYPSQHIPHLVNQGEWARGLILRAGAQGVHLPNATEPMMNTGRGRYIPAAQDPTDPNTWRVPVVFT